MYLNGTLGCHMELIAGIEILYFAVLGSVVIFLESCITLVTIWRVKALHSNAFIYVASLAVSDVVVGIICLLDGVLTSKNFKTRITDAKTVDTFLMGACLSTLGLTMAHMSIISVDRFVCVAYPFYYISHVTKKRIMKIVLTTWFLALLYGCVSMIFYRGEQYHKTCIITNIPKEYHLILASVYGTCIVIVFVSYFKIAKLAFLRQQASKTRKLFAKHNELPSSNNGGSVALRSVKFFVVMFGAVFLCTFPPELAGVISMYHQIPLQMHIPLAFLYFLNAVLHFFITFLMNTTFKQAVQKTLTDLLKCCCCAKTGDS